MFLRKAVVACALVSSGFAPTASAQELWVAPTYQTDLGGLGIGSNGFWPATAVGAVRLAFAVPLDLLSMRSATVSLIPHASGAATLVVYACGAGNGVPVASSCQGPVNHPYNGVANQLKQVDISAVVDAQFGTGDPSRHVTILAYTTPSTATDHIVGLRFAYRTALFTDTFGGTGNTLLGFETVVDGFPAGSQNTAVGGQAMMFGTTGSVNTAVGYRALFNMASSFNTGSSNTGVGGYALHEVTTGSRNTAIGAQSMYELHAGNRNTGVGADTLAAVGAGSDNTAVGTLAAVNVQGGHRNTAVGAEALGLYGIQLGVASDNVAVGYRAGFQAVQGSHNIHIANEGFSESNTLRIGTGFNPTAQTGQSRAFIAGIRGVTTGIANGVSVLIDSAGQLGTTSSSRRYKDDIRDLADASSGLMRLRPVQFRYKEPYADGSKPVEFGLVAEEVADVYPDLVVYDHDGRAETVQYHKLIPMLLNEVQKLQREVDGLKSRLAAGGGEVRPQQP